MRGMWLHSLYYSGLRGDCVVDLVVLWWWAGMQDVMPLEGMRISGLDHEA